MSVRGKLGSLLKHLERDFETLNQIEVSQSAILENYDHFSKKLPGVEIWPALKANAYGHGLKPVVRTLAERNFAYFVVDSYYEALQLWEHSNKDVLLIGYTRPENFKNMKFGKLAVTVYDLDSIRALSKVNQQVRIHLNVDTGMHRLGIALKELSKFAAEVKKHKNLELEGLYSHFASADEADNQYTKTQLKTFEKIDVPVKHKHIANTEGANWLGKIPHSTNAMRLGLGLYMRKPALRFRSQIIKVNSLKKGDKVSYGGTFTTQKDIRAGVIPVGYYEGLDRRLSNKGFVKYKDTHLPIIGRVCMNLTVIDLKNTDAKVGSEIEVISPNPTDKNSAENMAKICKTIPYEILVNLAESTRRITIPSFS